MISSLIIVTISLLLFYLKFEKKDAKPEEIVLIAILAAIAAIARIPFAAIASVQATSFVIIVSAIVFGKEAGFMIGSIAAIVSNIFLGQGPWMPWQVFSWGMMGLTAGVLKDIIMNKKTLLLIFGFLWGFIFGWIMNLWSVLFLGSGETGLYVYISACVASFYFDLAHALSNVFFLLVFRKGWTKILLRAKKKYGLLNNR
jgi:energy-coupling factor transport system substrate-specific component